MPRHSDLVEIAKTALNEVFSDRSVDQQKTRASLEKLREEISTMLDALPNEA